MRKYRILTLIIASITIFAIYLHAKQRIVIYDGTKGNCEIQASYGFLYAQSDTDTNVVFTDVETKKEYEIGYLTHGMREKITLPLNHKFSVKANGILTLYPCKEKTSKAKASD